MSDHNLRDRLAEIHGEAQNLLANLNQMASALHAAIDSVGKRLVEPLGEMLVEVENYQSAAEETRRIETARLVQELIEAQNRLVSGLTGKILDSVGTADGVGVPAGTGTRESLAVDGLVAVGPSMDADHRARTEVGERSAMVGGETAPKERVGGKRSGDAPREKVKPSAGHPTAAGPRRGRQKRVDVADVREEKPVIAVPQGNVGGLAVTEEGVGDDLSKLTGVGPLLLAKLKKAGIVRFRQIARPSEEDAKRLKGFEGVKNLDLWVKEAEALMGMG